ncbi:hypothetical protein BX265_0647 [Streptomyces sp. TLI_235]|nr:hypothetical protein [Streptomyces sp. TLI_235]PBC75951.1 hypothetical protein BX265_0647 [Streptomyces sp. TLI_235]
MCDQDVQSALNAATAAFPGDPSAVAAAVAVEGVAHTDPVYPGPASDPHNIAVIQLSAHAVAARWSFTPATLPTAGRLDALGPQGLNATPFQVTGYGTQEAERGPGGLTHPGGGVRLKAPVTFDALNPAWARLAMTAPQGNGGACYGDSGGPNFATVEGKLTLVATTITGDGPCYATTVSYRLDAPSARAFLAPFRRPALTRAATPPHRVGARARGGEHIDARRPTAWRRLGSAGARGQGSVSGHVLRVPGGSQT